MPVAAMRHDDDPRAVKIKEIGSALDDLKIMGNQVLVATYIKPEVSRGGIIFTDRTRDEDKFQGKVGLVIQKGPQAFVPDANHDFAGDDVAVHDWIFYRMSDGWQLTINGVHCRMLEDVHIKGVISAPDVVY